MKGYELNKAHRMQKWPHMTVIGDQVTAEQAADILIRTDSNMCSFLYAGNQPDHVRVNYKAAVGCTCPKEWDLKALQACPANSRKLRLNYLKNAQIVSAYIGGPHGWVDWQGRVFANSFNTGKWPSEETLLEDCTTIAEAFPFLQATFWWWSSEGCEFDGSQLPVYAIRVEGGVAKETKEPCPVAPGQSDTETDMLRVLYGGHSREIGLSADRLGELVNELYGDPTQRKAAEGGA